MSRSLRDKVRRWFIMEQNKLGTVLVSSNSVLLRVSVRRLFNTSSTLDRDYGKIRETQSGKRRVKVGDL